VGQIDGYLVGLMTGGWLIDLRKSWFILPVHRHSGQSDGGCDQMEGTEELIALFRKYGGTFDNMALGYREESGFYCYPMDSSQATLVACPSRLLVDIDDVDINQDGLFIENPDNYTDRMEFLEPYFAFHFNSRMVDQYIGRKHQIDALSSEELSLIAKIYPPCEYVTGNYTDLEYAKQRIINAHKLLCRGQDVIMPFVTFLNHAKTGCRYDITGNGVSISGRFNEEVFAMYNAADVILLASNHGFVTDTRFAYSVPMVKATRTGLRVSINREPGVKTFSREGYRFPLLEKDRGTLTISWFPLYFERDPLYPARVARMVADQINQPAEEFLYEVFRANLGVLTTAAMRLGKSGNPFAQLAGAAAQRQLELIGGTRS